MVKTDPSSSQHTPASDSEYNDYLRSRLPSPGECASNFAAIPVPQTRRRQRLGALADYEGRRPRLDEFSSPHTPAGDTEYGDYLRSRLPSQGEGASDFAAIPVPQTRRRQRLGALADYEGRRPRLDEFSSPHTPARDTEYGDYLRSRLPSQGEGASDFAAISVPQTWRRQRLGALADYEGRRPRLDEFSSPHTPAGDTEYGDYLRSRLPSQGEGASDFAAIPVPHTRRRQRLGALADYEGRRPRLDEFSSPHTPAGDTEYGDYLRSRLPSQGDGAIRGAHITEPQFPGSQQFGTAADCSSRNILVGEQTGENFFGTNNVQILGSASFQEFVAGFEKALVMFYDSRKEESVGPGKQFAMAADRRPRKYNHGFAAVDCSVENEICRREQACKVPVFKLYSNGFEVSTIRHGGNFNANQMQMLITMTPVLKQPKWNIGVRSCNP